MVVRITYDMVNAMQNFLNYERENFIKKKKFYYTFIYNNQAVAYPLN